MVRGRIWWRAHNSLPAAEVHADIHSIGLHAARYSKQASEGLHV